MKRKLSLFLSIVMMLSVFSVWASIPAFAADTEITIDGNFSDWEGKATTSIPYYKFTKWTGTLPTDFEMTVSFAADAENIYFLISATDDKLVNDNNPDKYEGDAMQVAINVNGKQTWHSFDYLGESLTYNGGQGSVRSAASEGGWTAEASIPVASIYGENAAASSYTMELLLCYIDRDSGVAVDDGAWGLFSSGAAWGDSGCALTVNTDGSYELTLPNIAKPVNPYDTTEITTAGDVSTINGYEGADDGWFWNCSSVGVKFDVADNLTLTKVYFQDPISHSGNDGTNMNFTLKVYAWNTDRNTTVAAAPLWAGTNSVLKNSSTTFEIKGVKLSGELYYELTPETGVVSLCGIKTGKASDAFIGFANGEKNYDGFAGHKGSFTLGTEVIPDPYKTTEITTAGEYSSWDPNEGDNNQCWLKTRFGAKVSLGDSIKLTSMHFDSAALDGAKISVYKWEGNYDATVAAEPLYTSNIQSEINRFTIPSDVILTGDLYYEVSGEGIRVVTDKEPIPEFAVFVDGTVNGTDHAGNSVRGLKGSITVEAYDPNANPNPEPEFITIDGVKDEIWNTTEAIEVNTVISGNTNTTAKAYLMWQDEVIYVLVEVNDSTYKPYANDPVLGSEDGVYIRLDLLHDKTSPYFTQGWGANNGAYRGSIMCEAGFRVGAGVPGFGAGLEADWEWWSNQINGNRASSAIVSKQTETGYIIEYKLDASFGEVGVCKPHEGQEIGLGVVVYDFDNDGVKSKVSMNADQTDLNTPSKLATVKLGKDGVSSIPEPVDPTITTAGEISTLPNDDGWFWYKNSFGLKFAIAEGLTLTKVYIQDPLSHSGDDGTAIDFTLKVYAWDTDYATTVAADPLWTGTNNVMKNASTTFEIYDVELSGDLYYELTPQEGFQMHFVGSKVAGNTFVAFINGEIGIDGVTGIKGSITVGEDVIPAPQPEPEPDPFATTVLDKVANPYAFSEGTYAQSLVNSIGHKFTVADGLKVTSIKTGELIGTATNYTFKVWKWTDDLATTVAADPICSATLSPKKINGSIEYVIPADVVLTGDLYWEVKAVGTGFVYYISNSDTNVGYSISFVNGVRNAKDAKATVTLGEISIKEANVSLGSEIALNVYATENATMMFTMNGNVIEATGVADGDLYKYTFAVTPQCMGDTITVELVEDGAVIESRTTTVKAILEATVAANPEDAELAQLVADLLNYGAKAQLDRNYNTGALVSDGTGASDFAALEAPASVKALKDKVDGITVKAAGVRFDYGVNKVYFKVEGDLAGKSVQINGVDAVVEDGVIYSAGLSALEFDKVITLSIDGTDVATYSVNSYVATMAAVEGTAGDLARALYAYGVSALAYQAAHNGN